MPILAPPALPRDLSTATIPVKRPIDVAAFEFSVLAGLRAGQLVRGCTPRVTAAHKITVTAQLEVAAGKVLRQIDGEPGVIRFAK